MAKKRFSPPLILSLALMLSLSPLLAQAAVQLSMVRKVFIDKMDNNLDQYLASEISQKFHGSLTVVLDREQADAILKGVNITAQNTTRSTVELVDPSDRVVLWSGSAGDKSLMTLDMTHGGQQKIASHLIGQLKKAMQR
jgi:hypothetical protein